METITTSTIDLLSLIGRDTTLKRVASTHGGEWAGPCPFCGGEDRFRVWPNHPSGKGKWWCRGCGRHGDAIDYLRQRDGLSYAEALAVLGLQKAPNLAQNRRSTTKGLIIRGGQEKHAEQAFCCGSEPPTRESIPVQEAVGRCQTILWQDVGKKARAYLHKRGLKDETLRAWGIGYNPKDQRVAGLFFPRGVVIPWTVGGRLWLVKVRRPVPPLPGPKYQQLKGGGKGALYGLDHLAGRQAALICEGEFDALLAWQEAGDLVDVVALGSATGRPGREALAALLRARRWFIATDRDDAGDKGADWWSEFSARVKRVQPLQGHDLTEFWQAGGDLRQWVLFHLDREGLAPVPDYEAQAEALLAREETMEPLAWAAEWARLSIAAGWDTAENLGEWLAGLAAQL
ncbi:MAG: hypothetical protein J7M16_00375 [Anaerolineae bacterium]|nr:hypothetical protein [Anaerolineae bacterium]